MTSILDSTAAKALTDELSKAAKEILNASHRLQKEFAQQQKAGRYQDNDADGAPLPCPDPVKLIRRIGALERTVTDLAGECEQIERRRNQVAPEVIATQQENIALVQELAESFPSVLSDRTNADDQGGVSALSDWEAMSQTVEDQSHHYVLPTKNPNKV